MKSILGLFALLTAVAAPAAPPAPKVSRAEIEAALLALPNSRETFRELKKDYPAEFDRVVTLIVEGAQANRSSADMRQSGFDEMRGFMRSKRSVVARAAPADLQEIGAGYAAMVRLLQREDPALCGRFSTSGFRPDDRLPPAAMAALDHVNALQLRAARRAETAPAAAELPAPSSEDRAAFTAAVRHANPAAADLLADKDRLATASDAEKCMAGVAVYDAAAGLPEAQSAKIIAALVLAH